jgi:hypothetical protein
VRSVEVVAYHVIVGTTSRNALSFNFVFWDSLVEQEGKERLTPIILFFRH